MTDLIRPALYSAEHLIVPVEKSNEPDRLQSVVGPVCESGDFLGKKVVELEHSIVFNKFYCLFDSQPRMWSCLLVILANCWL